MDYQTSLRTLVVQLFFLQNFTILWTKNLNFFQKFYFYNVNSAQSLKVKFLIKKEKKKEKKKTNDSKMETCLLGFNH
jgi:hypothetical protein